MGSNVTRIAVGGPGQSPRRPVAPQATGAAFDDYLGPADERYFGGGYRRTTYDVPLFEVAPAPAGGPDMAVLAAARVAYPAHWSVKAGQDRPAHLSTVDALVLGARAVEEALAMLVGLPSSAICHAWLRSLSLRTGATPVRDLDGVPVSCWATRTAPHGTDEVTSFRLKVGTFNVSAEVVHPARGPASTLTTASGASAYGDLFRDVDHRGRVTWLDAAAGRGTFECVTVAPRSRPGTGLESGFGPQPSLIDALVFAGQMLQILICAADGTTREQSGNLWLRQIRFDSTSPRRPAVSNPLVEITDRTSLARDTTTLHGIGARCDALFGSAMSAQVAYAELPS